MITSRSITYAAAMAVIYWLLVSVATFAGERALENEWARCPYHDCGED